MRGLLLEVSVLNPDEYDLETFCKELVECATRLTINVEAPFRGTTILATPTSTSEELVANFRRRLEKHREEQKNLGIFSMDEQVKYKGM
jgi:hypothetical protein